MRRRSRGIVIGISVLLLLLPMSGRLLAQEGPSVAVLPIAHPRQPQLAQVAGTVEDTIAIAFKLLERYRYVELEGSRQGQGEVVASIAERYGIDNVISGSVEEAGGGVRLTLSVFNRAEGRVVLEETGTTDSFLEIFNLTDAILLALLGGFTESRIEFGEVRFVNTGVDRDYVVRSGGQVIGRNVRRLERVVTGTRRFEIADDGVGRTLFDGTVDVAPGELSSVSFRMPFLYPDEEEEFLRIERLVGEGWTQRGGTNGVESAFGAAAALVRSLQGRRTEALESRYEELAERYRSVRSSHRGSIDYYPIDLEAGIEQWEEVPFKISDPGSRTADGSNPIPVELQPGSDIEGVKLARDEEGRTLYFLMTLANGAPSPEVLYSLNFHHDNFEYYQFRLLPLMGGWRPEIRIWRRDNSTETLIGNFDFVRGDSWIMGAVDIETGGLREMMKEYTYSCHAKTERADDWGTYNITRSSYADLFPARTSGPRELPGAVDLRWLREDRNQLGTALDHSLAEEIEKTVFLPPGRIRVDGEREEWRGIPLVADSWEQQVGATASVPERLYLAKDRRNIHMLLETDGNAEALPRGGTITELVIWGDMADESWQYFLELRLQEGDAYVSYRRVQGRRNEGVGNHDQAPQGRYAISENGGYLEMSFPLAALRGYLDEEASYFAEFRVWEPGSNRITKTPRFLLAPY